ncbi:MAG TPA: electron transport complex subunit RsxD [Gammaproteobacteria bacterium]|nr:electron transport complex subunit RsxD [Gammaproteobacteria bacterium]
MEFPTGPAPHVMPPTSVSLVMRRVLYALVPGTVAYVWFFGWGVVFNMVIATAVALACELVMLAARDRPIRPFLTDMSAVVTAVLLGFSLPPLAPWWVTALGSAFAIVFAKHLYGGLGYNVFNPAMAGYAFLLVCFPVEMTTWPRPDLLIEDHYKYGAIESLTIILTGAPPAGLPLDAITSATPLDTVRTGLSLNRTIAEIRSNPLFGDFGGRGWEWIGNWLALGGIWLLYKKVIRWHIPVAMLGSLAACATVFYLIDPGSHGSPGFHIFSGAAILGAFFIATDPVTAATSDKGRLIYGAGIGILTFVIRTWGGYPDGVAFAVLLMNGAAPLIDHFTKPRAYGHERP